MPNTVLAAQLYTLRDSLKTPDDIARTLPKVAALGCHAVQLSALGPIDTRELKQILDSAGLTACATHVGFERYIVEQDTCQRDPLESLGISLRNLQAMGLR